MTGIQGLLVFVGGPVAAVLFALFARARPWIIVSAAVAGELIAFAFVVWWSGRLLRHPPTGTRASFAALAEPTLVSRAVVLGALCLFAALVGALGIGVMHLVRRSQP